MGSNFDEILGTEWKRGRQRPKEYADTFTSHMREAVDQLIGQALADLGAWRAAIAIINYRI